MKLLKLGTLFFICLIMSQAKAQDTAKVMSFSLKEAQEYAATNSYQTQLALKDVEKSKKKVQETIALGLPQINGSAGYNYNIELPVTVVPAQFFDPSAPAGTFSSLTFGTKQTMNAGISVNQLIFDGSYIVGLQASKVYKELAINDQVKSEIQIKDQVTQAYGGVLVAERNVIILNDNLKNIEKTVGDNKELYASGFIAEQDYDQLKLLQAQTKNAYNNAKRQKDISKNMLKFAMGIEIVQPIELTEKLDEIATSVDAEGLLSTEFDIEKHIDYKIINTQLDAGKLLWKQQKSTFLPKLSAVYNFQYNSYSQDFNFFSDAEWFRSQFVGLNLNVPIFSSTMRLAKTQQAEIDYDKVKISKTQVEENIKLNLETARSDYAFALDQYTAQKDNMELAQKIFDKEQIKYQEGISSSLELTQANNQLLSSQGDYLNSTLQLISAKSKLDKALNNY